MAITTTGGLILSINGNDVTVSPTAALGDVKKTGASYSLPERVAVGTAADFGTFLSDSFGAPALPGKDSFPAPLDSVYEKLTQLTLNLEKFSIKIPPTQDAQGNALAAADQKTTSFTVGLSVSLAAGQEIHLIGNALAIKGVYVTVSKDDT
jgi:hypothetical protein